jgi:hypothetical protein
MEQNIFKFSAFAILVASIFTASMVAPAMLQTTGVVDDAPNFFITVKADDDGSPGPSGDCGIVNVYVIDQTTTLDPNTDDITSGHADVWAELPAGGFSDGVTLDANIPYNQEFIIVVETLYNYTVAYNVSTPGWDTDYVSGTISSSDLAGVTTETSSDFVATDGTTSATINYWADNSNAGWSIAHGETTSCSVVINGFW